MFTYSAVRLGFYEKEIQLKELTFKDAAPFIERIPDQDKLTLIGGQALCFWHEFYSEKYHDLFSDDWLISTQDIDFLGGQAAVRECAKAWNATPKLSLLEDHTPNSGVVVVDYDGEELIIDFLWNVQGMDKSDVEKERFEMTIPTPDGEGTSFYILSPFLCLVSRISNILTLHRTDQHSLDQLRVAIVIVNCLIDEYLNAGEEKQARNVVENVYKLAKSKAEGIRIFTEFDIDIFEAVPEDSRFNENFKKERFPRMIADLSEKRSS